MINQGTTFYFSIPFEKVKAEPKKIAVENELKEIIFQEKNILIVEDNDGNAELLKNYLEPTGIIITHAINGKQALEAFEKNKFDIILMDINLPDINGLEVTKQIKKINTTIPIISQTAYAMQNEKEKFLQAGCDDYISKPINSKLLIEKITHHLRKG